MTRTIRTPDQVAAETAPSVSQPASSFTPHPAAVDPAQVSVDGVPLVQEPSSAEANLTLQRAMQDAMNRPQGEIVIMPGAQNTFIGYQAGAGLIGGGGGGVAGHITMGYSAGGGVGGSGNVTIGPATGNGAGGPRPGDVAYNVGSNAIGIGRNAEGARVEREADGTIIFHSAAMPQASLFSVQNSNAQELFRIGGGDAAFVFAVRGAELLRIEYDGEVKATEHLRVPGNMAELWSIFREQFVHTASKDYYSEVVSHRVANALRNEEKFLKEVRIAALDILRGKGPLVGLLDDLNPPCKKRAVRAPNTAAD